MKKLLASFLASVLLSLGFVSLATPASAITWSCSEWDTLMRIEISAGNVSAGLAAQDKFESCQRTGQYAAVAASSAGCNVYSLKAVDALTSGDSAGYARWSAAKSDCEVNTAALLNDSGSGSTTPSVPTLHTAETQVSNLAPTRSSTVTVLFSISGESCCLEAKQIVLNYNNATILLNNAQFVGATGTKKTYRWSWSVPGDAGIGVYSLSTYLFNGQSSQLVNVASFTVTATNNDALPVGPKLKFLQVDPQTGPYWMIQWGGNLNPANYKNLRVERSLDQQFWSDAHSMSMASWLQGQRYNGGYQPGAFYRVALETNSGTWETYRGEVPVLETLVTTDARVTASSLTPRITVTPAATPRTYLVTINNQQTIEFLAQLSIGFEVLRQGVWVSTAVVGLGQSNNPAIELKLAANETQLQVRPYAISLAGEKVVGNPIVMTAGQTQILDFSAQKTSEGGVRLSSRFTNLESFEKLTVSCGALYKVVLQRSGSGYLSTLESGIKTIAGSAQITASGSDLLFSASLPKVLVGKGVNCTWNTALSLTGVDKLALDHSSMTFSPDAVQEPVVQQISAWASRVNSSSAKLYAKNIIGVGKVEFFLNGRQVAWANALSVSDSKLRVVGDANYLVRTLKLVPGKNVLETYLNGARVQRTVYSR